MHAVYFFIKALAYPRFSRFFTLCRGNQTWGFFKPLFTTHNKIMASYKDNIFVCFFSFCFLVLGVIAFGSSLLINFLGGPVCEKSLYIPLLVSGIILSIVSLLGFMGSYCKSNFLLSLYLFAMFLLAVWFVVFAGFVVIVTTNGVADAVSKLGFKDYRLGNWLQRNFVSDKKWKEIRSCMIDAHQVCRSLDRNNSVDQTAEDFYKRNNLSPVQAGCCIPPVACGFQYQNATFWIPRTSGPAAKDNDCSAWSNHQQTLCYNCDSCKAGVITNVKKQWRVLATINFCLAVFIAIFYSAGCCDMRNKNRRDDNKSLNQCLV